MRWRPASIRSWHINASGPRSQRRWCARIKVRGSGNGSGSRGGRQRQMGCGQGLRQLNRRRWPSQRMVQLVEQLALCRAVAGKQCMNPAAMGLGTG